MYESGYVHGRAGTAESGGKSSAEVAQPMVC